MALHGWDVSIPEAIALQRRLAPLAREGEPLPLAAVATIGGVDASYREVGRAAIVVFTFPELRIVETATAVRESVFPYTPGLLSFREGPVVVDAMAKLRTTPDLLMFDGQGYAHRRRLGLAAHLGLYLDRPSIGCAKSRLTGHFADPGPNAGDRSPLMDRGEVIGMVLRSKPRTNPLFISVGYRTTLDMAVEVTLGCLRGYRLPEPTRAADALAGGDEALKTFRR